MVCRVNFTVVLLFIVLLLNSCSVKGESLAMYDKLEKIENSKTWKELFCDGYSIHLSTFPWCRDIVKLFEVEDRKTMRIGNRMLSPDNKKVIFDLETYKSLGYRDRISRELYLINVNNSGSSLKKLEFDLPDNIFLITFLGNDKVLLQSYEEKNYLIVPGSEELYIINVNTNEIEKGDPRINQSYITKATVSSSGVLLVYPGSTHVEKNRFVVYNTETKALRKIDINGDRPEISPDGQLILFRRGGMTGDYYILHLGDLTEELLLSEKKIQALLRGSGGYRDLEFYAWSPDGQFILLLESSDLQRDKGFALEVKTKRIEEIRPLK